MTWRGSKIQPMKHSSPQRPRKEGDLIFEDRVRNRLSQEGIDEKYTQAIASFLVSQQVDIDDASFDELEDHVDLEEHKKVYMIFDSMETAKEHALHQAAEELQEKPDLLNFDWMQHYVDTKRLGADLAVTESQELAESARMFPILYLLASSDKTALELQGLNAENISIKFNTEYPHGQADTIEDKLDVLIHEGKIKSEHAADYFDYEGLLKWYVESQKAKIVADPVAALENRMDRSEIAEYIIKNNYIDTDTAIKAAVKDTGIAPFLHTTDGRQIELDSGGVAYRVK